MEKKTIHAALEQVVMEHGAYVPIELMMGLGILAYPQYEAWHRGELDVLEDALSCGRKEVIELLVAAANWSRDLGLVPEAHTYLGWGGRSGRSLRFFRDDDTGEQLMALHYRRETSETRPQLDIFLDSGVTAALNGLVDALVRDEPPAARAQLERLVELEPRHRLRPAAEILCDALDEATSGQCLEDVLDEFIYVQKHLQPCASAVLGTRARDFLSPFWRKIGERLQGVAFDPIDEDAHGSWVYGQVLDWSRVRDCVLGESDWRQQPVLILRLGQSLYRLGDRVGAAFHFFQVCWDHPASAKTALARDDFWDPALAAAWREFQELDSDPELSAPWFPSWLLLVEPGLSRVVTSGDLGADSAPRRAFYLLRELLRADADQRIPDERAIELRKALKSEHAELLRLYLEKRAATGT